MRLGEFKFSYPLTAPAEKLSRGGFFYSVIPARCRRESLLTFYLLRCDQLGRKGAVENKCPTLSGWNKQGGVPCLRRSGFAQAGRQFSVLTYWKYAPRANNGRPLRDATSNTAAFPSTKLRACFFEPTQSLWLATFFWANLPLEISIIQHSPKMDFG